MCLVRFLLILSILLIPINTPAVVQEFLLDNGLKVLVIEDHKSPLATFQIWYRVGTRTEEIGKTGISHLLEHMMFKGTPKYGSKVFSNIIQRNGGIDNAYTTKDYTMYYQTVASDRIGLSVQLEADRMRNLLLDPREVVSERNVVMEERRMRTEDDPQNMLYEEVLSSAFKSHPYRSPVIGWMSDIASIDREDLAAYYRTYYSPGNAVIVVAGDVKPTDVISLIRAEFGKIPQAAQGIPRKRVTEEPQRAAKRIVLKKEAELPYVLAAYHTPNFPDNDSFALDVLSSVLSDGKSSRFYKEVVYEKRLALNAFADYNGFSVDPHLFIVGGTAAPGKDIADVEKALAEVVDRIKKEPPTEREIQKAKNQVEAAFVFAQDSIYSQGLYRGLFEMMGGWRLMDRYLEGIRKVRPEDVQAVAVKYITDPNRTVGVLVPLKEGR